MAESDCGRTFDHDPHAYVTSRNKVMACDGSTTKRPTTRPPRDARAQSEEG